MDDCNKGVKSGRLSLSMGVGTVTMYILESFISWILDVYLIFDLTD